VTLVRRPVGAPVPEDFALGDVGLEDPGRGQVRVRVRSLSLDPYVRSLLGSGHLAEAALPLGSVVPGRSVAEVVDPGDSAHPPGSLVLAETGWRSDAVVDSAALRPVVVPAGLPPSVALGALGMPGLTAYAAHVRHLRPRPGDTVVVSAATGGVGSVSGALARRAGARAVAIVGSREKAEVATARLGYDAAVVRTDPRWLDALDEACPDRIHGYAHLADQATLDGVMERLAAGARVSLVGVIDQNNGAPATRLRVGAVMVARATVHGMVVHDHLDLTDDHVREVSDLLGEGVLELLEDTHVGLARAPEAFSRLLLGRNVGKVVVHVHPESSRSTEHPSQPRSST